MDIKRKHMQGFISADKMDDEWLAHWKNKAQDLDDNGMKMIVFSVPEDRAFEIAEKIEELIQMKMPE